MVRNIESRDYIERIKPMRVTIGQLTEDYLPHTEKGNKAAEIEVVPRRIVEEIIKVCREKARLEHNIAERECKDFPDSSGRWYARSNANASIADFAEGLLEIFEGD